MAQHDYNLANQSRTSYRADQNNLNSAIMTQNSGASAPTTTAQFMPWVDTDDNLLRIRNAADAAWLIKQNYDSDMVLAAKTGAYTTLLTDYNKLVPCDGTSAGFTVTLIAAATATEGFRIGFIKTDSTSNNITIDGNSSETINGALNAILYRQYDVIWLVCDGSNWLIESSSIQSPESFIEAETATRAMVTPDRVKRNPGVAKFWVNFNGTGTIAIGASYNVTSLTDTATGDYGINFTTNFSSATYAVVGMANSDAGTPRVVALDDDNSNTASACRVEVYDNHTTGNKADSVNVCVVGFGDQ